MKRRWWIFALGAVVVLFVGWRVVGGRSRAADSNAAITYSPVRVTRGSLSIAVDASGNVASGADVDITPSLAGRVTAVLVSAGDYVNRGQVLVRLDPTDANTRLGQAEDMLRVAQAKLRSVQESAAQSPAQARMEVDRARAMAASAKSKLDQLRAGASDEAIAEAKANVNQAQLSLDSAQSDNKRKQKMYAENADAVTEKDLYDANNKCLAAGESLTAAKARLSQLISPAKAEDIAAAEASLAQAQADLAIAESNLHNTGMEDQVAAAQADERKARDELAAARKDAANMALVAPFAGYVETVNAKVGAYVGAQTFLVHIVDASLLTVETEVDENDIVLVRPGQKARITLDAIPDLELEGEVLSVGGLGRQVDGVISFTVKISFADPEQRVKIGMSADASIIIDSRERVINVPNAVIETRMGRTAVRMYQSDGKTQYRRVTVGLRTDTATEVVEGLRVGEQIAVPATKESSSGSSQTSQQRGTMPFGGAMRMGR